MRILVNLFARADTAYDNSYHHKLRGRIWRALEGTEYDQIHDKNQPKPVTYSNPFPPRDMREATSGRCLSRHRTRSCWHTSPRT